MGFSSLPLAQSAPAPVASSQSRSVVVMDAATYFENETKKLNARFDAAVPLWAVSDSDKAVALTSYDKNPDSLSGSCYADRIKGEIKTKYGYETPDQFDCLVLKAILYALKIFPEGTFPLFVPITATMNDPTRFTLNNDPAYKNAGAVTTGGQIDLTSKTLLAMRTKPSILVSTVVHEIGHQLNLNRGYFSYRTEWLDLGHWKEIEDIRAKEPSLTYFRDLSRKVNKEIPVFQKVGIISKYAMTDPVEDFAESVAAYLLIPEELNKISPGKYSFIRDRVFPLK